MSNDLSSGLEDHSEAPASDTRGFDVVFDHHSRDYVDRGLEILDECRSVNPVALSSEYGGFYLVTGYEAIREAARRHEVFSSAHVENDPLARGVTLPDAHVVFYPAELDPPKHLVYRRILNPYFSPQMAEKMKPTVERWSRIAIDSAIESGKIDLVLDYSNAVAALFTCELLGLPASSWRSWADKIHRYTYSPAGTPEKEEAGSGFDQAMGEMCDYAVGEARAHGGEGVIAALVEAEVDGQPLNDAAIENLVTALILGGFDTTSSLGANMFAYLSDSRDDIRRLRENEDLIAPAVEEFLRYFSPAQGLARTVVSDIEIEGCPMRAGDRVLLSWQGANHDPEGFDNPHSMQFDRSPNRHVAFGFGVHRCIGADFARMELQVMLRDVTRRLSTFAIDKEKAAKFASFGMINGWATMPATFHAAAPEGQERLP